MIGRHYITQGKSEPVAHPYQSEHLLLFPGGDGEVGRAADGEVELRWKAHADFVRMVKAVQVEHIRLTLG